jgi:hypothetical protein
MDINAIKAKLSALNNTGNNDREKVDYEKVFWKPANGKHQVRIVPSAYDPTFPFKELKFHYGIGKYPMIALSNFGKQDPVEEFVKELKKTSDKDNWSLAGKLSPKTRIFAPVVVRGEEHLGVRLWGFGVTIYKALLALAEDEDVGDYTDTVNGYDMIVEQTPGNPYPQTTVRIKPKMSPLSENAAQAEEWMKTQPSPTEVFTQYDYEFIKKQLQNHLDPNSEEASTATAPAASSPAETTVSDFTLENASKSTQSVVSQFDDLFE